MRRITIANKWAQLRMRPWIPSPWISAVILATQKRRRAAQLQAAATARTASDSEHVARSALVAPQGRQKMAVGAWENEGGRTAGPEESTRSSSR
jgi:hypothetical protein